MARLKAVEEVKSVRFYREWSKAKEDSKDASEEVAQVTKRAVEGLNVSKWAWNQLCRLRRKDPAKALADLRDFDRLRPELLAEIESQTDLEDAIREVDPAA